MTTAKKKPSPKRQARALARQIGELLLQEYTLGKELNDYSKVTPLQVPPDMFQANLASRRRAYQMAVTQRGKAAAKLKALLKIEF